MDETTQALAIFWIVCIVPWILIGMLASVLPLPLILHQFLCLSTFIGSLAWWWNKYKGTGVFREIAELTFGLLLFCGVIALAIFAASLVPTTFGKIAFTGVLTFFVSMAKEIGKRR